MVHTYALTGRSAGPIGQAPVTRPPTPPPVRYDDRAPAPPEGAVDLRALVPGDGPLELDIGFGRGRSFLERARARVSRMIGVELKAKLAYQVEAKRIREGLDAARAFRTDARELLERAGPDGCVQRVFVHFPDPWWKKRHAKRMVVTDDFLDTLARLIASGGELYVQTDVEERALDYEARLAEHPAFEVRRIDANPFAKSNREVRAEADGLPVYRLLATRR